MKNVLKLTAFVVALFITACSKEVIQPTREYYSATKPTIEPGYPFGTELLSTFYRGYISDIGTVGINKVGICYGTVQNPTLNDNVIYAKNADLKKLPIIFDTFIDKVAKNKSYQIRSFVVNDKDTVYSVNNFFKTPNVHEWVERRFIPVAGKSLLASNKLKDIYQESLSFFTDTVTYFCYKNDNYFYKYNSQFYTWQPIADLPISNGYENKFCFMANNSGFCGVVDKQNEVDFFKYQEISNKWTAVNDKPSLKSSRVYSFSNTINGFVLNKNLENSWDLWEFETKNEKWIKNEKVLPSIEINKVISNNDETYVISQDNSIFKFSNGEFTPFFNLAPVLGKNLEYEVWIVKNRIFINTISNIFSIDTQSLAINNYESFDISERRIGAIQMKKKMFLGNKFRQIGNERDAQDGAGGIGGWEFMIE